MLRMRLTNSIFDVSMSIEFFFSNLEMFCRNGLFLLMFNTLYTLRHGVECLPSAKNSTYFCRSIARTKQAPEGLPLCVLNQDLNGQVE